MLAGGLVGVGFLIRRDPSGSLRRLGLIRPTLAQLVVAIVIAELLPAGVVAGGLTARLTPDTYAQLNGVSRQIYGGFADNIAA